MSKPKIKKCRCDGSDKENFLNEKLPCGNPTRSSVFPNYCKCWHTIACCQGDELAIPHILDIFRAHVEDKHDGDTDDNCRACQYAFHLLKVMKP